jgi:hypothetical protein
MVGPLSYTFPRFGLGLINESVVRVLSDAKERHRFMPTFAVVMGVAALLATVLHGIEAATWASAYLLLGALPDAKSAMLYSLSSHQGGSRNPCPPDPLAFWRWYSA